MKNQEPFKPSKKIGSAVEQKKTVFNQMSDEEQRIQSAILQERERIGMDLHDGIIQALYAIGLNLQNTRVHMDEDTQVTNERLNQAIKDLDEAIRNIRTYILDLRPRQLQNENLLQGMRGLIREFRANTLVEVELQGEENEAAELPAGNAMALFHIFQEALANIARHADASKVTVRVWRVDERVMMRVSDDGVGFDPARVEQRMGHGLANMQTRAQNAGGGIEIISIRKQGTTILAWVPLNSSSPPKASTEGRVFNGED